MKKQNMTLDMARGIIKALMGVAVIMCVLALAIGEDASFSKYAGIIAVVCIAATFFVIATSMKCPYCGKVIIRKCLTVKACPHCGRNLATGLRSKKRKH